MKKIFTLIFILLTFSWVFADDDCNNYYSVISPDGNYIYFSSDRHGGSYQIYRVDINGYSNPIQLSNLPGNINFYPAISPDGSLIAFQSGSSGYGSNCEIYIMNADGSNLQQLTDNSVYDGYPNFSPDGTKIVFDAWDDSAYPEVFTMNIDGTDRTQLTNEPGAFWQSAPLYNPSGTKIYFSAGFNADNYYVMMDLNGTNWVNITEPNDFGYSDYGLHFNDDGTKIVFYTMEWVGYNYGCDIVIADADGSNWNRVTNSTDGKYFSFPFFNTAEDKVLYSFYWPSGTGKYSIKQMNLDATNDEKISNCSGVGVDENIDINKNLIYPNPVNDFVQVNFKGEFVLEIFDLAGRLLLKTDTKQSDISQLTRGVYMAVLKDGNNKIIKTEKLIKQ